jgi:ATP-dependent helicase/nuclease subunit B
MTKSDKAKGQVFTIAGRDGFARALASGLSQRFAKRGDPLALCRVTLLVPTRRAVLSLRQAFVDLDPETALLMPQILPLGDVGEDDIGVGAHAAQFEDVRAGLLPQIAPLRRQLLLARLIERRSDLEGLTSVMAATLAGDLARFFDAVETEEADLRGLDRLVPENLAVHWQRTVTFLRIVTEHWPGILADQGVMDPARRRSEVLDLLAKKWTAQAPAGPVVIAGSTGSIPATQSLMRAVLTHETGLLVLPGLDRDMPEEIWAKVTETHPQFGLKALLEGLDIDRAKVVDWDADDLATERGLLVRGQVLSQVMLPAETTESWHAFTRDEAIKSGLDLAFDGLARIEADNPRLEALTIALIMREAMEEPGKTIALVTPDRGLARRVSVELKRWELNVDDSAGVPLKGTPVGSFLVGILDVFEKGFAPIALLSLLKHPLTGLGMRRPELRALAARLEIMCLRGVQPAHGFDGLRRKLIGQINESLPRHRKHFDGLNGFIDHLEEAFKPLLNLSGDADPVDRVRAHGTVAETLAGSLGDDGFQPGSDRLWVGEAGEAAASFFSELLEDAEVMGPIQASDYLGLFDVLLSGRAVRLGRSAHPRAFIWGPLEARLQSANTIIMGGLNEKTWPQAVQTDPWLSRPMRAALAMSQPERRIGQSAHDFTQLASASHVILTRSLKVDGAPTVASRWLMRLENMLKGLGAEHLLECETPYLAWAKSLDKPVTYLPCGPPLPKPPVSARPRSLSVTEIETWLRDPYAIYCRHVLGLRPLDSLDISLGALERGISIHTALERFLEKYKDKLPENAVPLLMEEGVRAFDDAGASKDVLAFWLPRFGRIAQWFIAFEEEQRTRGRLLAQEVRGQTVFDGPGGPFTLTGRGDRFDLLQDGSVAVYDYKTGQIPSRRQVENLIAPQLPLEAIIAENGGFEGVGAPEVSEIGYIQVSGGREPGGFSTYKDDIADLIARAAAELENFIGLYDQEVMPYRSRVMPLFESRIGPYDHLARVKEWSVYGADEGGGNE